MLQPVNLRRAVQWRPKIKPVATTTQVAAPVRTTSPLALWHLLSLDAPSVAALWTWFVARCCGIRLSKSSVLAMALAVWIVYVADRLLDTRHLSSNELCTSTHELEARHLFHFRYRGAFLFGAVAMGFVLALLLPGLLQTTLQFYASEGALLMGWFLVVHGTSVCLPKEVVVGTYFAVATFTPTFVRHPPHLRSLVIAAGLFAALCTLNCLLIHAWERAHIQRETAKLTTAILSMVLASLVVVCIADQPGQYLALACGLAAILLVVLNGVRSRLSRIHMRAAADLALLTPLLVAPFFK